MSRKLKLFTLCAVALLVLLTACGQRSSQTRGTAERNPFSVTVVGESGTRVSLDAYSDGYRPGTTDTFQLAVQNGTQQVWTGNVCLQLLEPSPSDVVLPLGSEEFDLQPGSGYGRDLEVGLPADLAPGTYGLALVVNGPAGPSASVTTVYVGQGQRAPFHGDWPTDTALAACPAP